MSYHSFLKNGSPAFFFPPFLPPLVKRLFFPTAMTRKLATRGNSMNFEPRSLEIKPHVPTIGNASPQHLPKKKSRIYGRHSSSNPSITFFSEKKKIKSIRSFGPFCFPKLKSKKPRKLEKYRPKPPSFRFKISKCLFLGGVKNFMKFSNDSNAIWCFLVSKPLALGTWKIFQIHPWPQWNSTNSS